jgi:ribosomal-protein-alanine N-acetyltransferase
MGSGRVRAIVVEHPSLRGEREFLEAVRRSRKLHRRWAAPPSTPKQYRDYIRCLKGPVHYGHFVYTTNGELAGVINVNDIVRGVFNSGYLGYYAFAPHAGHGYMRAGLMHVLRVAFREYGLHRVEANIQPQNARSIALVEGLGFRREGFSPRYLKLGGRWRDHERWALTIEEWQRLNNRQRARGNRKHRRSAVEEEPS